MIAQVISHTHLPRRQIQWRRAAPVVTAIVIATAMAGCKTASSVNDATSSYAMAPGSQSGSQSGLQNSPNGNAAAWAERYRANPKDPVAAVNHANILRAGGQRAQAVAVLELASIHNPKNMEILGAYGRALADVGNFDQALDVLNRAHMPDRPDLCLLSVQGAVLDQMGRHEEAQRYYATALRIVPDDPSVLSNLGLSYALSKDLVRAELTLRRAMARPNADQRVRQNLALVVGLQGRFPEAETIAKADLPPEVAAANMGYLRQMLAQQNQLPVSAARGGRGS